MKKIKTIFKIISVLVVYLYTSSNGLLAQNIGINTSGATPDASAILDLNTGNAFTSPNGKGLLIPNVGLSSSSDATTIGTPKYSLLVYNTGTDGLSPAGYYYNANTNSGSATWIQLAATSASTGTGWFSTGNSGTIAFTNYIGTNDAQNLVFKIYGKSSGLINKTKGNTYYGYESGDSSTATGMDNTAMGYQALGSNTSGFDNTAVGYYALSLNNIGVDNTAIGWRALYTNHNGIQNTAIGWNALGNNYNGNYNIAIGEGSMENNYDGEDNTSVGYLALSLNTNASSLTAIGYKAGFHNIVDANMFLGDSAGYENSTGAGETFIGYQAGSANTTGANNVALGYHALLLNTIGFNNTAIGNRAMGANITGNSNTAIGDSAGYSNTGSYNTFLGDSAGINNTAGNNNTFVGYGAGSVAAQAASNNCTYLGYEASAPAAATNNIICLGNTSITHIYAQSAMTVTAYSDRRVKDSIRENVPGLAFITKLHPVTFHYNIHKENQMLGIKGDGDWTGKYDVEKIIQSGFIAQQVDSAAQACGYEFSGVDKPRTPGGLYGLGYTAFVVPLVKSVQELDFKNDSLKQENQVLKTQLENINAKVDSLEKLERIRTISIDKLKAKYEVSQSKDEADIAALKRILKQIQDNNSLAEQIKAEK